MIRGFLLALVLMIFLAITFFLWCKSVLLRKSEDQPELNVFANDEFEGIDGV